MIGVAGGSGITPFHSFAKAIADDDEEKTGYEHGFVTADLIKKKLPQGYFDLVAVITFYRVVFSAASRTSASAFAIFSSIFVLHFI